MSNVKVASCLNAAPEDRGRLMLQLTEDQWFDRKAPTIGALKHTETLVAMANAEGGTVAVGLSSGKVLGTNRYQETATI